MDKYDEAIEWLVAHADDKPHPDVAPTMIDAAWREVGKTTTPDDIAAAHCLFQFVTESGNYEPGCCGCLTQVRARDPVMWGMKGILLEIKTDERLASDIHDLEGLRGDELRAALQPFAEWQRRLDREIRQPSST